MGTMHVFLLIFIVKFCVCDVYDIQTQISDGDSSITFTGVASNEAGYNRAMFKGIRYGNPPNGNNRFKKTTQYKYNETEVDARKHGFICPQEPNFFVLATDVQKEDCLFLNIFVPLDKFDSKNKKLSSHVQKKKAVYIFVHGGSYVHGSSNFYDTARFAAEGDIIAVAINYRLGLLGFMTSDDEEMQPNLGLWDQQLAIQWVYDHIEAFGGDKTRITIGGQSSGSMCVVLQAFHEGNDKLFQNFIAESGSPIANKFVSPKGFPLALQVAKIAGCPQYHGKNTTTSDVYECLSKVSPNTLVNMKLPLGYQIAPVFDNDFISEETFNYVPQTVEQFNPPKTVPSVFANKNFLTGFVSDEGDVVYTIALQTLAGALNITNDKKFTSTPIKRGMFRYLVEDVILQNTNQFGYEIITDAVEQHYIDGSKPITPASVSQSFVDFGSDFIFKVPILNTAHYHTIRCQPKTDKSCNKTPGKTFVYEFKLPTNITVLTTEGGLDWFHGTRHGSELIFLSDKPQLSDNVPGLEDFMITAWSNFVKTGNPNGGTLEDWKEYTSTDKDMYHISNVQYPTTQKQFEKNVHFWNEYLPELQSHLRQLYVGTLDVGDKDKQSAIARMYKYDDNKATSIEIARSAAILSFTVAFIFTWRQFL